MELYLYFTNFNLDFLIIGGDYDFTIEVREDFYTIYRNAEGRKVIKEGWTCKLDDVIQKKMHLPCCFAFKRIKYRAEDICTSDGYCRQKNCSIKITSTLPHRSNKLTVCIENYQPKVVHETIFTRKILSGEKEILLKKLEGKSAYALRSELADEVLTEEHCNPGRVPTLNALRVMKSRNQTFGNDQNAVLRLYELQNVHINCIQKIDLFPFAVHYSTPSQQSWYKNEFSGKKRSTISIDASGFGLTSPTGFKKYIFLYIICAHGK